MLTIDEYGEGVPGSSRNELSPHDPCSKSEITCKSKVETGKGSEKSRLPAEQAAQEGTRCQDLGIMTRAEGSGLIH